jgi:hypothetical protein
MVIRLSPSIPLTRDSNSMNGTQTNYATGEHPPADSATIGR